MPIKRLNRNFIASTSEEFVNAFIESDFRIRSGLCPNKCGLMEDNGELQTCPACHFTTNARPDRGADQ